MGIEVNLFHMLITGPFLMFVGLVRPTHKAYYYILLSMALLLLSMFAMELPKPWALVHIALLVPLLAYVGLTRNKSGEAFSFLVAVGIAAVGYHVIKAYKNIMK